MLAMLVVAVIAAVIWGADKSLSLKDEGLYLLAARYPDEISENVSAVYRYTGFLFKVVGYDVASFRITGLVLIALSAIVFWLGFIKFVSTHCAGFSEVHGFRTLSLLFIALGGLLHYQWALTTPSYYTLTAVAVNSSAGLTLFALGALKPYSSKTHAYLSLVLSGMAIGAAFVVKFPAGVLLSLVTVGLIFIWSPLRFVDRVVPALAVGAGFVLWALLYFAFVQGPSTTLSMFRQGWSLYQTLGAHAPGTKILAYPLNVLTLTWSAIGIYWPCYVLLVALAVWRLVHCVSFAMCFPSLSLPVGVVFAVAALLSVKPGAIITFADRYLPLDSHGMTPFYIAFYLAWILLLLASYLFFTLSSTTGDKLFVLMKFKYWVALLFLFFVPFAASVGTANPLYNVISFYAPAWFGIILFLAAALATNINRPNLFGVVLLIVGAFAASNTVLGSILAPSEMPIPGTNLLDQTASSEVGFPPHKMMLLPEQHRVITELRAIADAAGFQPGGDDIIAVDYLPGLVFALGGRSPRHPTFLLGNDGYLNYSKAAMQFSDVSRRREAFLLIDDEHSEQVVEDLMNSGGLDYPARYRNLGTVTGLGTKFTLYKPND
ncbi:hypothetical protein GCM10010520_50840 [Rhizobium viscosum]